MQTSPISRVIVVRNKQGLHMRPWTTFAQVAHGFESRVEVVHLGRRVDARSPIELMTLAAGEGTQLTLEAEGNDAQQAVEALADLVENVFPQEDTEHDQGRSED